MNLNENIQTPMLQYLKLYTYKIYGYTLKGENNIVIKILRCFNLFLAFIPSEVLVSININ